ncbi:hypothetical protein E4T56_gene15603 [Termitomyces sp. T112]|nr:hypothetical protein E4T56_gene15603 [Termitomyces sp. T112]
MPIFQLKYTSTELTTMPNFEILYDNICIGSTISIHLSQARESLSCVVKLERNDDQPILNQTQELIVVDEPPSTTPSNQSRVNQTCTTTLSQVVAQRLGRTKSQSAHYRPYSIPHAVHGRQIRIREACRSD